MVGVTRAPCWRKCAAQTQVLLCSVQLEVKCGWNTVQLKQAIPSKLPLRSFLIHLVSSFSYFNMFVNVLHKKNFRSCFLYLFWLCTMAMLIDIVKIFLIFHWQPQLFKSHELPRQNFSLKYQDNMKQTSDENKEKY